MKRRVKGRAIETSSEPDFFDNWLQANEKSVRTHSMVLLREKDGARGEILDQLREAVQRHYIAPEIMAKRLAKLGAEKTAALFRERLPTSKRIRSGELGEILATEFVNCKLEFDVPILRLRWKDGREMPLRGDDVVAFRKDKNRNKLVFLKGEAKSRERLTHAVVRDAAKILARGRGRPNRHSVLFVAEQLWEQGANEIAALLDDAVLKGFSGSKIEHLLFTFSGNSPISHLFNHLQKLRSQRRRHAVGLQIKDHNEFIRSIYED